MDSDITADAGARRTCREIQEDGIRSWVGTASWIMSKLIYLTSVPLLLYYRKSTILVVLPGRVCGIVPSRPLVLRYYCIIEHWHCKPSGKQFT